MLRFTFMAQCHVQNELVVVEEEKNVALKIEEKIEKRGKNSAVSSKQKRERNVFGVVKNGITVSGRLRNPRHFSLFYRLKLERERGKVRPDPSFPPPEGARPVLIVNWLKWFSSDYRSEP
jgi:hypothetical protein